MKNILIIILAILVLSTTTYIIKDKFFAGKSKIALETVNQGVNNIDNKEVSVAVNSDKILNLSNQGLKKAPSYIFNQTNLEELNLSNNSLEGSLQAEVRNLQNLKVLNLSNNKFSGLPAEVGQLKNLEILNLSNNTLTGLPNELGNLSKLKLLDLSGNNYSEQDLSGIRKSLPSSTTIKTK